MSYRISTPSSEFLTRVRSTARDDQDQPVRRFVAEGGEPVRDRLRRAVAGEALILASYRPFDQVSPFRELGPASLWARLEHPLIAGQPIHPLDRVLTLADFPNGFGNAVPFDRFAYINPDLTVSLHRLPDDEWVLLDAHMHARATGHGSATGTLADARGALGTATQSLLISAR